MSGAHDSGLFVFSGSSDLLISPFMDLSVCRATEGAVYSSWNINNRLVRLCGQLGVPRSCDFVMSAGLAGVVREQVELVGVHLELLFIHGVEEAFDLFTMLFALVGPPTLANQPVHITLEAVIHLGLDLLWINQAHDQAPE